VDFEEDSAKWTPHDDAQLNPSLRKLKQRWMSSTALAQVQQKDPASNVELGIRFVGSPGTGKTHGARQMGRLLHHLKILGSSEVIEVAAKDFLTGYAQQAGIKTTEVFDRAKGKVLFIDEAYSLAEEPEVLDTLIQLMTSEKYIGKMAVILAGYENDIEELMSKNEGFKRRFQEMVVFEDWTAEYSTQVLFEQLRENCNLSPDSLNPIEVSWHMDRLRGAPKWGNGGDVTHLGKVIYEIMARRLLDSNVGNFQVHLEDITMAVDDVIRMKETGHPNDTTLNWNNLEWKELQSSKAKAECRVSQDLQSRLRRISGCTTNDLHWVQVRNGYRCAGGAHFVICCNKLTRFEQEASYVRGTNCVRRRANCFSSA
jgi:hypothetical protein